MAMLNAEAKLRIEAVNAEIAPLIEKLEGAGKKRIEIARALGIHYQSYSAKKNGFVRWQESDLASVRALIKEWGL